MPLQPPTTHVNGTSDTSIGYTMTYLSFPTIERQGIANILSCSLISPVEPLNPTPPDFITVPHAQRLHSERGGEVQNSTQNPIEKNGNQNGGIFKDFHENEINNDEYIEEIIPET